MMNETGNHPGQPRMWLYTSWYVGESRQDVGEPEETVLR
jgi:hypothetical protein